MIQRALGDACAIDDVLNTGGLKPVQMHFAERGIQYFISGILGRILVPALPPGALFWVFGELFHRPESTNRPFGMSSDLCNSNWIRYCCSSSPSTSVVFIPALGVLKQVRGTRSRTSLPIPKRYVPLSPFEEIQNQMCDTCYRPIKILLMVATSFLLSFLEIV